MGSSGIKVKPGQKVYPLYCPGKKKCVWMKKGNYVVTRYIKYFLIQMSVLRPDLLYPVTYLPTHPVPLHLG